VWVHHRLLLLNLLDPKTLKMMSKTLGRCLDNVEEGDMYACDNLYVEVNLEKGLLKAFELQVDV
jgi:hypothetical protein